MLKNIILLLSTLIIVGCCVKRHINIISDPPGATVFIDGEKQQKQTPIHLPFNFYGTREITLIKDGYHIVNSLENVNAPFYQRFPLDFFVEFLVPVSINDEHSFHYYLKPYTSVNDKNKQLLLDRANKQQP